MFSLDVLDVVKIFLKCGCFFKHMFFMICSVSKHQGLSRGRFFFVVYKQFPGIRGELQGGVLEGFDLFFGEFSDNFPDDFSVENPRKSPY